LDRFAVAGVPSGSVRDVREALADPQLLDREMIRELSHPTAGSLRTVGTPIKLSETPGGVRSAPPYLGQHTDSVLRDDLGLSERELVDLEAAHVIKRGTGERGDSG